MKEEHQTWKGELLDPRDHCTTTLAHNNNNNVDDETFDVKLEEEEGEGGEEEMIPVIQKKRDKARKAIECSLCQGRKLLRCSHSQELFQIADLAPR